MSVINTGKNFSNGEQLSADKLNLMLSGATFDNSAVDLTSTFVDSNGAIIVKDGGVTTAKIADSNVTTAKIANNSVTTAKIADSNVTTTKIANSNVTTDKIADANVTTTKIADSGVTTAKIADSNVITTKIADNNVTTAKIADSNVTTAKIADSNVTTTKIADGNVTTAKIADGGVTTAKIADGSVTTTKIADSNITTAKIADANVTFAKLTDVIDDDTMATASATTLATSESIKAYVDTSKTSAFTPSTYTGGESVTLPNGFIMKTGSVLTTISGTSITFGTPFPNGVVSALACPNSTENLTQSTGYSGKAAVDSLTTSGMNVSCDGNAYWQAFGY